MKQKALAKKQVEDKCIIMPLSGDGNLYETQDDAMDYYRQMIATRKKEEEKLRLGEEERARNEKQRYQERVKLLKDTFGKHPNKPHVYDNNGDPIAHKEPKFKQQTNTVDYRLLTESESEKLVTQQSEQQQQNLLITDPDKGGNFTMPKIVVKRPNTTNDGRRVSKSKDSKRPSRQSIKLSTNEDQKSNSNQEDIRRKSARSSKLLNIGALQIGGRRSTGDKSVKIVDPKVEEEDSIDPIEAYNQKMMERGAPSGMLLKNNKKKEMKESVKKKIVEDLTRRIQKNEPYMKEQGQKLTSDFKPSQGTYFKITNIAEVNESVYGEEWRSFEEQEDSKGNVKPRMTLDHYYNIAVKQQENMFNEAKGRYLNMLPVTVIDAQKIISVKPEDALDIAPINLVPKKQDNFLIPETNTEQSEIKGEPSESLSSPLLKGSRSQFSAAGGGADRQSYKSKRSQSVTKGERHKYRDLSNVMYENRFVEVQNGKGKNKNSIVVAADTNVLYQMLDRPQAKSMIQQFRQKGSVFSDKSLSNNSRFTSLLNIEREEEDGKSVKSIKTIKTVFPKPATHQRQFSSGVGPIPSTSANVLPVVDINILRKTCNTLGFPLKEDKKEKQSSMTARTSEGKNDENLPIKPRVRDLSSALVNRNLIQKRVKVKYCQQRSNSICQV